MTKVICDTLDCLNINRETKLCTLDEVDLRGSRGACRSYKQDKAWLDEQLHRWIWYPLIDSEIDYVPVRIEKDESVRE